MNGWHTPRGPSSSCHGLVCAAKTLLASSALPLGMGWWGLVHVSHLQALSLSSTEGHAAAAVGLEWRVCRLDVCPPLDGDHQLICSGAMSSESSKFPQGTIYLWRDPICSFLPFLCLQPLWERPKAAAMSSMWISGLLQDKRLRRMRWP